MQVSIDGLLYCTISNDHSVKVYDVVHYDMMVMHSRDYIAQQISNHQLFTIIVVSIMFQHLRQFSRDYKTKSIKSILCYPANKHKKNLPCMFEIENVIYGFCLLLVVHD
ncbi:hypothetical protein Dimus_001631 [Dionaea muscipula]